MAHDETWIPVNKGELVSGPQTSAWTRLLDHAESARDKHLRDLRFQPENRAELFTCSAGDWVLDFTRQRICVETLTLLQQLADDVDLTGHRDAMFAGEKINATEGRAVLHTALRAPVDSSLFVDGVDVVAEVHAVLTRMRSFTSEVLNGTYRGSSGQTFTDVVNIGIGGSDLGPVLVTEALRHYQSGLRPHYISNVDPTDAYEKLRHLDPARTLVLIASKTFTTAETMANAEQAREWLRHGLTDAVDWTRHLVALSSAPERAAQWGIPSERVFGFWDWVGGRYSVASSIGLSAMLAIGAEAFDDLLAGMHQMDEHFRTAPLSHNLPAILGLLAVWNRNFLDISTQAVLPYSQELHRLPAYLQQLTMESNGKSVDVAGAAVRVNTSAVIWGEPGTNGQHSFHQLIHQGTEVVASDIVIVANSSHDAGDQQATLLANALAQAHVMAVGRNAAELALAGVSDALIAHKLMPGNRPCSLLVTARLNAHSLGALIALYEHSVFTQGVVWGINSFDQWGVEFGKEVATALLPAILRGDGSDSSDVDPLTSSSLSLLRKLRAQS